MRAIPGCRDGGGALAWFARRDRKRWSDAAVGLAGAVFSLGVGNAVGEAAAIAIGGTIGLDAMFGGPISGASMNPMRSLGPALVSGDLHALWVYILAPVAGTSIGGLAYQFVRGEQPQPAALRTDAASAGKTT